MVDNFRETKKSKNMISSAIFHFVNEGKIKEILILLDKKPNLIHARDIV